MLFNLFHSQNLLAIHLTVCHTILMTLVWKILELGQLITSWFIFLFILITFLLDIVRRNSFLVTHRSLRLSLCGDMLYYYQLLIKRSNKSWQLKKWKFRAVLLITYSFFLWMCRPISGLGLEYPLVLRGGIKSLALGPTPNVTASFKIPSSVWTRFSRWEMASASSGFPLTTVGAWKPRDEGI